ncbi:MAG: arylesterase [SAR86 cluster bacterium]|uniref:Arylesterase n=1 Tax=SAR86 cluster bacterium TaxID=2030880 RepID=A0A2A5B1A3_9GAMM|nr:MAG: arylesterase [SAR86 cluster bacterium]
MRPHLIRLLACLTACMIFFSARAVASEFTLLVFGDSLSAAYGIEEDKGWVTLLDDRILLEDRPYRVVNGSVSGETSTGGLARLPAMLESYSPDLLILELGGNDGLRGLPINLLKQNLQEMILLARNSGAQVVLTGIQIPPNYGPRYTIPFTELYGELATQMNIALVPFLIEGIPQKPELMQNDGIHPRAEAQFMILDNVWSVLEPMLKNAAEH